MEQSAVYIEKLNAENKLLKSQLEEPVEMPTSEAKNECDDNKERTLINKLKKKVNNLSVSLQEAEEMITVRDKEVS